MRGQKEPTKQLGTRAIFLLGQFEFVGYHLQGHQCEERIGLESTRLLHIRLTVQIYTVRYCIEVHRWNKQVKLESNEWNCRRYLIFWRSLGHYQDWKWTSEKPKWYGLGERDSQKKN